jgi:flagellin
LTTAAAAQAALTNINGAISSVAATRGQIGAAINRLQSAVNVIQNQSQNLSAAEDGIRAADIAQEVANMTKYSILNQTGISSLAQANQMQQSVLKLLQ